MSRRSDWCVAPLRMGNSLPSWCPSGFPYPSCDLHCNNSCNFNCCIRATKDDQFPRSPPVAVDGGTAERQKVLCSEPAPVAPTEKPPNPTPSKTKSPKDVPVPQPTESLRNPTPSPTKAPKDAPVLPLVRSTETLRNPTTSPPKSPMDYCSGSPPDSHRPEISHTRGEGKHSPSTNRPLAGPSLSPSPAVQFPRVESRHRPPPVAENTTERGGSVKAADVPRSAPQNGGEQGGSVARGLGPRDAAKLMP